MIDGVSSDRHLQFSRLTTGHSPADSGTTGHSPGDSGTIGHSPGDSGAIIGVVAQVIEEPRDRL